MRRVSYPILICLLVTGLGGCKNESLLSGPEIVTEMSRDQDTGDQKPFVHHDILDMLDYERIEGSIEAGFAGIMPYRSETWPGECWFGLNVPKGAVQTSTQFVLRFPTYQSYMEHADLNLPLIVRLEPEHVHFPVPVTVMATYMPWIDGKPPSTYWNAEPVYDDAGNIIDTIFNEFGRARIQYINRKWQVHFKVNHFSDWEVGDIPEAMDEFEFDNPEE